MPNRITVWSCAALLAALSISTASTATAQLGRLKKIATDAVKDAAKDPDAKKVDAKVDYIVTEERATAVLAVLTPIVERTRKAQALVSEQNTYESKSKAFSACMEKSAQAMATPDMSFAMSPAGLALQKKQVFYATTAAKAQAAKDYKLAIATSDSATVSAMVMALHMTKSEACGNGVYKPASVIAADAERMAQTSSSVNAEYNNIITVLAAQRAGMTQGQFGRIREAMAIWSLQKAGQLPASAYKFTDAEQAVLNGKATQLATLAPLFKSGSMVWQSWGDIASW